MRSRLLEDAGRLRILSVLFTTGILVGIGEIVGKRIEALTAIRDLHRRYGHVQDAIIQHLRAVKSTGVV